MRIAKPLIPLNNKNVTRFSTFMVDSQSADAYLTNRRNQVTRDQTSEPIYPIHAKWWHALPSHWQAPALLVRVQAISDTGNGSMRPLSPSFNRVVLEMANSLMPEGWIARLEAPTNLSELEWDTWAAGKIVVSSKYSDCTIFGSPKINHAFRAWHDWCHLYLNAEFDRAGETTVYEMQSKQLILKYGAYLSRNWRQLLRCEIIGQLDYVELHGHFPVDQQAFAKEWLSHV